jgi:alkylation response protein AidB-like acyl-CoA dehydrogenase
MLVPRDLGCAEASVRRLVEALEALAAGDGAAGWCAMISATTGTIAATLPRDAANSIFGNPRAATGGVVMPPGKAIRAEGGFQVSGRWAFGSGGAHAEWMLGGCAVLGPDGPEMIAEGVPHLRLCLFPRDSITFHDTWHVSGLRATGSNDFEVRDLFVPEAHTSPVAGGKRWAAGALYAFPLWGLLAIGVASVGLGIARGAIDELTRLATQKTPMGSRRPLAERAAAQSGLAEAEALTRSGRAFLLETVDDVWSRVSSGDRMSTADRALLRLAATTAAMNSARSVDICYNLGGATSLYESSPLQRQFRDIHAVTQHVMVGQATLEVAGRVFLGVPTDTAMF